MKKITLYIGLALMLSQSCNDSPDQTQKEQRLTDTIPVNSDSLADTAMKEIPMFGLDNLTRFGDSLAAYWKREGYGDGSTYSVKIDTFKQDQVVHHLYHWKKKKNTYPYGYQLSIYEFANDSLATDFFNDMKTREMVVPFGLNKSPNHILLDGNKVYWHYYNHPTGHRYKDFKKIFREVFRFYPVSSNLDSVSGFTYCQCIDQDADLSGIKGSWVSVSFTDEFIKGCQPPHYTVQFSKEPPESLAFTIGDSTVKYDGKLFSFDYKTSKKLPDTYYYFMHTYFYEEQIDSCLTAEFRSVIQKISAKRSSLTEYDLNLDFLFIKLNDGSAYCSFLNRFYRMKKM